MRSGSRPTGAFLPSRVSLIRMHEWPLYNPADAVALHTGLAGRRGRQRAWRRQLPCDPWRETDRRWFAARRRRADIDGGSSDHCPPHLVVAGGNRSGDRGAGLRGGGLVRSEKPDANKAKSAATGSLRSAPDWCRKMSPARQQTARHSGASGARLGGLPPACRARIRAVAIRQRALPPHRLQASARGPRWLLCSMPISAAAARRRFWPGVRAARPARRSARSCSLQICAVSPSCRSRWLRRQWSRCWTPGSTVSPAPFTRSAARC